MAETFEVRCECREDASRSGPGRLYGVLMVEGDPAVDRPEKFAPGALQWPEGGVALNLQHDRKTIVQRVVPARRGREVVIDEPIIDTARGRDLATMIRAGAFGGLSVEFRARRQRYDAGRRVVLDALLLGAAVVDDPSYAAQRGLEVREKAKGRRVWL